MPLCYQFHKAQTGEPISLAEADDLFCEILGVTPDPDNLYPAFEAMAFNGLMFMSQARVNRTDADVFETPLGNTLPLIPLKLVIHNLSYQTVDYEADAVKRLINAIYMLTDGVEYYMTGWHQVK